LLIFEYVLFIFTILKKSILYNFYIQFYLYYKVEQIIDHEEELKGTNLSFYLSYITFIILSLKTAASTFLRETYDQSIL